MFLLISHFYKKSICNTIYAGAVRLFDVMQWTDRIHQIKILLVLGTVFVAVASLAVAHFLISDLEQEERKKMEVWAEAMNTLNNADEWTDLNLVLKVLNGNTTIPVIVMDRAGNVQTFRNLDIPADSSADRLRQVAAIGMRLRAEGRCIRIDIDGTAGNDDIEVCYDDSRMLKLSVVYPFVQLGAVIILIVAAVVALLTSKRAEQNRVWAGLSKETAHQLGTPISSLMAWTEILRERYPQDELIPEIDSDVKRLQLIADRFSKIGSTPESVPANLNELIAHVVDYMSRRTSDKVCFELRLPSEEVTVNLNVQLFEWVIENLCKNAVDALDGTGTIIIGIIQVGNRVLIDVTDTGKGIRKKDVRHVFRPGFTTKQRGWGLGLPLAKRIVEDYHHGKIRVKESEPGHGTTFRIELRN